LVDGLTLPAATSNKYEVLVCNVCTLSLSVLKYHSRISILVIVSTLRATARRRNLSKNEAPQNNAKKHSGTRCSSSSLVATPKLKAVEVEVISRKYLLTHCYCNYLPSCTYNYANMKFSSLALLAATCVTPVAGEFYFKENFNDDVSE
jgi:hypothetical protein